MPSDFLSDWRTQAQVLCGCAAALAAIGFVFGQSDWFADDEPVAIPFAVEAEQSAPSTVAQPPQPATTLVSPGPEFEVDEVPARSSDRVLTVSGSAAPGTRVFSETDPATHDDSGSWSVPVVLVSGPNDVLIEGLGPNGKIESQSFEVFYEPGTLPEVAFSAAQQFVASQEEEPWEFFTGTATPLSTVNITSDFGSAAATVDETGAWSAAVFFDSAGSSEPFPVVVEAVNGSETFGFTYEPRIPSIDG